MNNPRPDGNRRASSRTWRSHPLFHLALAIALISLFQAFFIKLYVVPSESMEMTLTTGDRILVNRMAYLGSDPQPGQIVVFNGDERWRAVASEAGWKTALKQVSETLSIGPGNGRALVKRLVAGPGDQVSCCSVTGDLLRNGSAVPEPYLGSNLDFLPGELDCLTTPKSRRCFPAITLPPDEYLVLGDNRSSSADSVAACRGITEPTTDCFKTVNRSDIVGEVLAVAWPLSRLGTPR